MRLAPISVKSRNGPRFCASWAKLSRVRSSRPRVPRSGRPCPVLLAATHRPREQLKAMPGESVVAFKAELFKLKEPMSIQGNRISDLGQHGGQESFAQGGAPELFAKRTLGGFAAEQIERHVAQNREVLRCMIHAAA